jgi:hypothetical protein
MSKETCSIFMTLYLGKDILILGDFDFLNFHAAPEFGQIKRGKPFNFINDVAENKRLDG